MQCDHIVGFDSGIRERNLWGPTLSKASRSRASEQAKQVLEEKLNGVVQEVLAIKHHMSARSQSDSTQESPHDQVVLIHWNYMLLYFVQIYLQGLTFINYSTLCRTGGPL